MKTYFSTTVEAAVELARRELGSEAMLVNSRPTPEDVRHLGRYEVIFATGGQPAGSKAQVRAVEPLFSQKGPSRKPAASAGASETQLQLDDIRLQLTTIRQSLWTHRPETEPVAGPSDASLLRRSLEANGVEPAMARELIHSVLRQNGASSSHDHLRAGLAAEMEKRFQTEPSLHAGTQKDLSSPAIVALVGPPGRGKSTMLVKLAIAQGLARRAAVRILSMDNYRVGSSEQMRCFGAILGVSFNSCQTIGELDHLLGNTRGVDVHKPTLTLIDTSGYGPAELGEAADLAAYLSARPEISVQMVLRADAKTADGVGAVQRYSQFGVSRLIFTGLDEAETFGSLYSIAVQTGRPISFLGTGQRIPEDLEPAVKSQIVELVLGGREAVASVAA